MFRPKKYKVGSSCLMKNFARSKSLQRLNTVVCFLIGAAALLLTISPTPAGAQTGLSQHGSDPRKQRLGANVTKETNPQSSIDNGDEKLVEDSYQAKGIELGSFLLLPQIETELSYNSNVFAQSNNKKSDFISKVSPELVVRSRFVNHALNFVMHADQVNYKQFHEDDHLDMFAIADGRYDFSRTWEANGFLRGFQRYEDRGSPDAAGGKHPTFTSGASGRTGTKLQAGRYTFSGNIALDRLMFQDSATSSGATINNTDRNRWETSVEGRGSYEIFPGYAAVISAQGNRRQYDDKVDDNGYNRSSAGWRLMSGIGVDISQLIRGDFLVGYMSQDYEDTRLNDPKGISVSSTFNWTPSRVTVVVLSLERTTLETTTVKASGMVRTGGSVMVRHEALRNLVLTGTGSVYLDKFEGAGQENWTYDTRARATWALGPKIYLGGELGYRKRTSNVASSVYDQAIVALRLGLRI